MFFHRAKYYYCEDAKLLKILLENKIIQEDQNRGLTEQTIKIKLASNFCKVLSILDVEGKRKKMK